MRPILGRMKETLVSHDHRLARSPEHSTEPLQATLRTLEDGIDRILDSESFATYLRALSRFHDYSFGNIILILSQRPDATRVAGYRAWQSLGRQVRKGERGIKILVPHMRRVLDAEQDDTTKYRLVGYGVGTVFDISQTDGDPLPHPPAAELLQGESNLGRALYQHISSFAVDNGARSVSRQRILDGSNGYYRPDTTEIAIADKLKADAATKTLAHETAHFVARHRVLDLKADVETVAESTAYVVLNHFGIDSGSYSFGYVAAWAKDREVLRRNLAAIQQTSQVIITGVESTITEPSHTAILPLRKLQSVTP